MHVTISIQLACAQLAALHRLVSHLLDRDKVFCSASKVYAKPFMYRNNMISAA